MIQDHYSTSSSLVRSTREQRELLLALFLHYYMSVDGYPTGKKPSYMTAQCSEQHISLRKIQHRFESCCCHQPTVWSCLIVGLVFYVNPWQGRIEGCKKTILPYIVADKVARGSSAFLSLDVHSKQQNTVPIKYIVRQLGNNLQYI